MSPLAKTAKSVTALLLSCAAVAMPAFAASTALDTISVVSVKQDPLLVYSSPSDDASTKSVPVSGLPWKIKESKNDFYLVNIAGKDYWVDSMMVHANRTVSASCLRQPAGTSIAADLGASTDRCK
ncbi:hypothetical protein H3V53_03400 [Paraburkholderia bengalensis]|uniref:SH3 domain-containing protein n=1 Tax=Paraburkholderia bengalensis TaxID=2747562 RepID=A0ABU8ILA0_9BURK